MDAHVLVPLKAVDPKSRLGDALSLDERAELMAGLLAHVAGEIRLAGVTGMTVVCSEPVAGYDTWLDRGLSWNDALAAASAEVVTAPLVAFVSADLPRLAASEVRELLEA